MKPSSKTVDPQTLLNVEQQLEALTFKGGVEKKYKGSYTLQLQNLISVGRTPIVPVIKATLGKTGKKDSNSRGVHVIKYQLGNNGGSNAFTKVALGLKASAQPALKELCKGIFDKWIGKHSPTLRSTEYQKLYPELNDGTKVFSATSALVNTDQLVVTELDNDYFGSPSVTYAPFVFGDDDDATWYNDMTLSEGFAANNDHPATDHRIVFYDDKGRQIGNKVEDEVEVYRKGGVPLMSSSALDLLTKSQFYKKGRWECSCMVEVTSMSIKLGKSNDQHILYPTFNLRTRGSLRMQQSVKVEDPDALTFDQRTSIFDSIIFDGVTAPSRKRKRAATIGVKKEKKKVTKESSKVDKTPIDTDGESSSSDDDESDDN